MDQEDFHIFTQEQNLKNNMKKLSKAKSTYKASDASFFEHPYIDNLVKMNTEILTELWILKDRFHILEKVLEEKKYITKDDINNYEPKDEFLKFLDNEREKMIKKVIEEPLIKKNRSLNSILSKTKQTT